MDRVDRLTVTAQLAPHAGTAALLRVISILHARGTEVHDLVYERRGDRVTVTATVVLGNLGSLALTHSLLRPVEVIDVVAARATDTITASRRASR